MDDTANRTVDGFDENDRKIDDRTEEALVRSTGALRNGLDTIATLTRMLDDERRARHDTWRSWQEAEDELEETRKKIKETRKTAMEEMRSAALAIDSLKEKLVVNRNLQVKLADAKRRGDFWIKEASLRASHRDRALAMLPVTKRRKLKIAFDKETIK